MTDFYCPYCEHGMNKEDTCIHEDDVLGEWEVECSECKKTFDLTAEHEQAANNIDKFIASGEFDKAFRDVFGLPSGVVKSLGEVS